MYILSVDLFPYARSLVFILLFLNCIGADEKETPRKKVDDEDDWFHHFVTRPDIQAPKYHVAIHNRDKLAPGYWFISPYENIHKQARGKKWEGPYIYDQNGDLVWAGTPSMDYYNVHDFKVSEYNDETVLSGISRRENGGLFFNSNYELIKRVHWAPNWDGSNMHEFNVIEHGTRALVTTRADYTKLSEEISSSVGFRGQCSVRADGIKELDITTEPARILFNWTGIEHIPLHDSIFNGNAFLEKCKGNWDIHHLNSVDKFNNGDYLVSSRELSTLFRISYVDGSIVWRVGNRNSDWTVDPDAKFTGQHTARILEEDGPMIKLSVFANGGHEYSRGIIVQLNVDDKTVALVKEAHQPMDHGVTASRGSNQILPNGNFFACWAEHGRVSEHDSDGNLLMHAYMRRVEPYQDASYRGYKFQWVGRPKHPPHVYSAAFALGFDNEIRRYVTITYVSWNGATEVAKWNMYASNKAGTKLRYINQTSRKGFETNMQYEGYAEYVVMEALDARDQPIGRSRIVQTVPPIEGALDMEGSIALDFPAKPTDNGWGFPGGDDPMYTYFAGFFTCAGMWLAMRIMGRLRRRPWWRKRTTQYELVENKG